MEEFSFKGEIDIKNLIIKLIIGLAILFLLWYILALFRIDLSYPHLIEWATKFILPWIFLYWIIRLTKILEKR
ncbi:hypothetical protein GCM10011351_31030 [Paraliobacillus quinghaiensis]|uniref:Uncharacterized protein n=1 Tax=Paraliobacillus quinghaiensis TaxID=470815 RepID=A0A917TXP9_9BACI|nr:hypothetical protein [Paraliobacillus quinghaiensis]GGM42903.1 hypothetical protein GCM10011351_31030 [Paraliobacillus quinghaiensis]